MKLLDIVEADLLKETGCLLPCVYSEYKLLGKPILVDENAYGFQLGFARTDAVEEREGFVYEMISFVSEFGGALGLFLGFSFLDIWTIMDLTIAALKKSLKYI